MAKPAEKMICPSCGHDEYLEWESQDLMLNCDIIRGYCYGCKKQTSRKESPNG